MGASVEELIEALRAAALAAPVREYVAIWVRVTDHGSGWTPRMNEEHFAERFRAHNVQDVIQMWTLTRKVAPKKGTPGTMYIGELVWTKLTRVVPFEAERHGELLPPSGAVPWKDGGT
jgi:hypothetical protein